MEKNQFELHQYYYSDSECTEPVYSVIAKGKLYIGEESWIVPGGLDSEYALSLVTLMPYTDDAAQRMKQKVKKSCRHLKHVELKAGQSYTIFQYGSENKTIDSLKERDQFFDTYCTAAVNVVFHELQLLRMEVRKKHLEIRKSLFLGDIHSDLDFQQYYRPRSYQEPLIFQGTAGCHVCQRILESTRSKPPVLFRRSSPKHSLYGHWYSTRCEVRPVGEFLTRQMSFDDKGTWQASYFHFSDTRCHKPSFTVRVQGLYALKHHSHDITDGYVYDMSVTKMYITAQNNNIVKLLNQGLDADRCAKRGSWVINIEQDVTSTNGCEMLSLKLPMERTQLVKTEKEHHHMVLLLGTLPSSGADALSNEKHLPSTSFQPPLVKCTEYLSVHNLTGSGKAMQLASFPSGSSSSEVCSVLLTLTIALATAKHNFWFQI